MRRAQSPRPILLVLAVALAAVLVACGGSGTVETSQQSEPRTDAGADDESPAPTGASEEYCRTATEIRSSIEALDEDPEAGLESLGELADVAPEELRDDFEVTIDRLGQLEGLDEDDPSSFSKVFEIMLDPALLDALGAIDAVTLELCGFTLDPESDGSSVPDDDVFDDDGLDDELFGDEETSISLEDVEAIEEQNESTSWAGKLTGTFIVGGSDLQLSADVDPFTDDEALELCEAMLEGLSPKNRDVSISVLNGEDELASSGDDGTCSLS